MSNEVVHLIKCPNCTDFYIDAACDLVCDSCAPKVRADMLLFDLATAVTRLDKELTKDELLIRKVVLKKIKAHLDSIVELVGRLESH